MRNTITFAGRLPVLCMMTGVALASFATLSQAASDDYHLGVMDKLRIRVAEWQPADGSIKDWDVVGGDYTVGPGGTLSLPFLVIFRQPERPPERLPPRLANSCAASSPFAIYPRHPSRYRNSVPFSFRAISTSLGNIPTRPI